MERKCYVRELLFDVRDFEHPSLKHFYDFIGYERYLDQFMGVWNNAN